MPVPHAMPPFHIYIAVSDIPLKPKQPDTKITQP